jgi:hypothetical protein
MSQDTAWNDIFYPISLNIKVFPSYSVFIFQNNKTFLVLQQNNTNIRKMVAIGFHKVVFQ